MSLVQNNNYLQIKIKNIFFNYLRFNCCLCCTCNNKNNDNNNNELNANMKEEEEEEKVALNLFELIIIVKYSRAIFY